ncbi:MAG: amidohydrolase family protein [Candidatus Acidiferrales bacterium]
MKNRVRYAGVGVKARSIRMALVAGAVACCAFALASVQLAATPPEGGPPRYYAIKDARIVPVSGPVIESGTVVVARGLIQSVGTSATIPPEAWVIDGKGLTVYPGLIDAGSSVGLGDDGAGAKKSAPGGAGGLATSPEDRPGTTPWRVTADELKIDDKKIESWRSAGFTTALVLPDGGIFPGQASVIDLAGTRPGEMVVRATDSVPISFRPVGGFFGFPDSLMGTIGYARQVLDDTSWYAQAEPIYETAPTKNERVPYDRTEVTLAEARQRNEVVLLPANNSVQILRALRLAEEWKFPPVLYGGQQGYDVVDALKAKSAAVIVNLKWPERAKDADPDAEQTLRELRFRDRAPGTPAALAKANVKFAFYSGGLANPTDIQKSVKKSIDAGLTSDQALRAFTLDAADILGLSDRMGSIAPGKIANLVVTDGDIFHEKTKVKHVFVDGRWFPIHEEAKPEKAGDKVALGDDESQVDRHSRAHEGAGR